MPSTLRAGLLMLTLSGFSFSGCDFAVPAGVAPAARSETTSFDGRFPHVSPPRDWAYLVLHHSATAGGSVESIDAAHRQRTDSRGQPWLGIGYHFVIGNGRGMPDGQVQATFRWREQLHGAHAGTRLYNDRGIGICLIGNFDDNRPSPKQIAATRRLVSWLASRYDIGAEDILSHGEIKPTRCPGEKFPWSEIVSQSDK